MRTVYVFLSKPTTFISKMVGFGTRSKLTHVSISLTDSQMKTNKKYFCSEFVAKILSDSANIKMPFLPNLMRPKDVLKIEGLTPFYKGKISSINENCL